MSEDSKDIPVSQPEGHLAEPPAAATPDTPSLRGRRPRFRRDGAGTTTERAATTDALTPADTVDEQEGDAEDTPIPATRAAVDVPADDGPNELDSAETTVQPARRALRQVKVVMQAMLGTTESSRRHPPLEALGSMIVLVALLVVVGLVSEALPQAPQTVMPGADVRLVCPGFADYPGVITGQMQGEARYGVIGSPGSDRTLSTQVSIPEVSAPSTLEAAQGASQLVARLTIADGTRIAAANCTAPFASQYLLFPKTTGSVLQITNPDPTDAVYNITVIGSTREGVNDELRDISLAPDTMVEYQLSDFVERDVPIGIRVQNTSGRLQAVGLVTDSGLDIVSASRSGRSLVAVGVPALAGVQVVITNPATVRINATVKVMTAGGLVDLAGAESVIVEASQSKLIDVTEAIMGRSGAVLITANNDVAASVVVSYGDDVAVIPAVPTVHLVSEPLLAAAAPPMTVVLANAGEQPVSVPVALFGATWETVIPLEIPAGGSTRTQVPGGTLQVRLEVPDLVAAALVSDQGGFAVTGLLTEIRDIGRTPLQVVVRQ